MACPICEKPSAKDYQPFCSRRCADVDLGKWLTESYVLPSTEPIDEAEDTSEHAAHSGNPAPPLH